SSAPLWPLIIAMVSAAFSLVLGWLHLARRDKEAAMNRAIDAAQITANEAEADAENVRRDLESHRLYAAENFPRKADVKADIEAMETRLNKRLDELLAAIRQH
ncbi:MAG TPA: hypothetical protein PLS69_13410, partial [Terricaulis sp.]|nr:hypothetical protein [Terricaulis sp.]